MSLALHPTTALCQSIPPAVRSTWATVRIPSHGCSGVIIYTREGQTLILTCAHAFRGDFRRRAMKINAPALQTQTSTGTHPQLLAVSWAKDLAIVHVAYGPVPFVANIASRRPNHHEGVCVSGYSRMRLPAEARCGQVLGLERIRGSGHNFTALITSHFPIGGQSGGPLLDSTTGEVVGITHGWQQRPGQRREGVFVTVEEIQAFLRYNGLQVNQLPGRSPELIGRPPKITERREFQIPQFQPQAPT